MRCDANISLKPQGSAKLGTKVEMKNLNSFRALERALEYEERRQAAILNKGGRQSGRKVELGMGAAGVLYPCVPKRMRWITAFSPRT